MLVSTYRVPVILSSAGYFAVVREPAPQQGQASKGVLGLGLTRAVWRSVSPWVSGDEEAGGAVQSMACGGSCSCYLCLFPRLSEPRFPQLTYHEASDVHFAGYDKN